MKNDDGEFGFAQTCVDNDCRTANVVVCSLDIPAIVDGNYEEDINEVFEPMSKTCVEVIEPTSKRWVCKIFENIDDLLV